MSTRFRVAVDIGNSSIKLASSKSSTIQISRISLSSDDWIDDLQQTVAVLVTGEMPAEWLVASVNEPASSVLEEWISSARKQDVQHRITRDDLAQKIAVRFPERVGIDRLLAAMSAYNLAGERAAIVIDAGTTITVDLVDSDGVFQGGAIIPGLGLQLRALHEATNKLPLLTVPDSLKDLEAPGKDTDSAMRLGVVRGVIGGIESLLETYASANQVDHIFLTGGDAELLSVSISSSHEVIDDLPLRGLFGLELSD